MDLSESELCTFLALLQSEKLVADVGFALRGEIWYRDYIKSIILKVETELNFN